MAVVAPAWLEETVGAPPQGQWTVDDWDRLPQDGNRYEVIEGVLYMSTAPTNFHQWIVAVLSELLGIPLKQRGLGYYFFVPIGVLFSPSSAVQPDFLVVLNRNRGIIRGGRIRGAPDLVFEVLSPGNTLLHMAEKQRSYAGAGVPEYVVINPATRTLHYYRLHAAGGGGEYDEPQVFGEGETVVFACLLGILLRVADLFRDAPDTTLEVE
jgi:Uma2 family endonuclease